MSNERKDEEKKKESYTKHRTLPKNQHVSGTSKAPKLLKRTMSLEIRPGLTLMGLRLRIRRVGQDEGYDSPSIFPIMKLNTATVNLGVTTRKGKAKPPSLLL